jgi:hypothetical protein
MVADGVMVAGQGRALGKGGRPRTCGLRARFQRFAEALLPFALLCAPLPATAASAVEISAVVGFTDTFRPGRWTPLAVTVTNRGSDLNGELEVQVSGGDELRGRRYVTTHRRKLELDRDTRKSLQFTVFPEGLSHPLVVRVRSEGRELARSEIDLRSRFVAERLILVLSRDANLDYLNGSATGGLRVLYPHPELLPAHWQGYDAVAAVVVHGVFLERLNASQFDALHKWIAQGGIVAVSGGPDYALLRGSRLSALLPAAPAGMTRLSPDALRSAFSASLDVSRPVHVNRLDAVRGRVHLGADATPLIVERTLGLGRVLYLAFDVAAPPFDRWDGMRGLWLDSLRLPPAGRVLLTAEEPTHASPLPSLIAAGPANFPSAATMFFFVVLYLGLLLAAYLLPGRALSRWQALARIWGAPLLFAPSAWLLFGPAAFPRDATAVTVAVIEPLPDSIYARLELDLGVYATRSGAQRLEYRGAEPVLYPTRRAQRDGNAQDWVFGEGLRRFIEPLDRRRYVLHALEGKDVIAFHLEASVRDETTGPKLVLENDSGRDLRDLWLLFDGYGYELGSVASGARLERRLARAHGIELGDDAWRHVLTASSHDWTHLASPARIVLDRRSKATAGRGYPAPGRALLIADTASPLQPAGASTDRPRQERALVAFEVAAQEKDK